MSVGMFWSKAKSLAPSSWTAIHCAWRAGRLINYLRGADESNCDTMYCVTQDCRISHLCTRTQQSPSFQFENITGSNPEVWNCHWGFEAFPNPRIRIRAQPFKTGHEFYYSLHIEHLSPGNASHSYLVIMQFECWRVKTGQALQLSWLWIQWLPSLLPLESWGSISKHDTSASCLILADPHSSLSIRKD